METQEFDRLKIDYENTVKYIFHLSEIRFKLLGFLPIATVIAFKFTEIKNSPSQSITIGLFGLVVTLGILYYDQRNTEIYDAYVGRAKEIELLMNESREGTFGSRASRGRKLFGYFSMWHDKGLALIYSSVFCIWFFVIFDSVRFIIIKNDSHTLELLILFGSFVLSFLIYVELIRQDDKNIKKEYWGYLRCFFDKKLQVPERAVG
ncbi:hypothetical protein [Spirosoma areae]